jgi:hypothetical protein
VLTPSATQRAPFLVDSTTLRALAAFPGLLEEHYGLFPPSLTNWRPESWEGVPSEPLTALEQVCHVRDIEIEGYQARFRRTLTEANPVLESIDTMALVTERGYAKADAGSALAAFHAARGETLRIISKLRPEDYDRPAQFEGYGPTTLRGLVHYLCSHDQQHLAGLQWLLGQISSRSE